MSLSPATVMPTLARSATSTPPTASGAPSDRATRSATSSASAGSETSSSRKANSSPPRRATVSPGRTVVRSRSPISWSTLVARVVPEAVVDRLEVVEVHEQDDDPAVLPSAPLQRVRDAVGEQRAVREPGQRVVEGLARELRLEHLALGDVAVVDARCRPPRDRRAGCARSPPSSATSRPQCLIRNSNRRSAPCPDARSASACSTVERSSSWTSVANGAALPVPGLDTQDPLHGDALEADAAVGVEDRLRVGRVLQQRAEPRLAAAQVRGELHEPPVLGRQQALRRVERAPQHEQQDRRREAGDDEHVAPRGVDEVDDRGRVLVDLVGADRRAVRRVDRQVDLEEVAGQADVEHVLLGVGRADVELARRVARERGAQVRVDVERLAAQVGQVGEQHGARRRPELDPRDAAGLHEAGEEVVDLAAGGPAGIAHRRVGEERVDARADRGLGAAGGLVGGRLGHPLGGVVRRDEGGAEDEHRRDDEHGGTEPRHEPLAPRVVGEAADGRPKAIEVQGVGVLLCRRWG